MAMSMSRQGLRRTLTVLLEAGTREIAMDSVEESPGKLCSLDGVLPA
jgi:hypothetical protein